MSIGLTIAIIWACVIVLIVLFNDRYGWHSDEDNNE